MFNFFKKSEYDEISQKIKYKNHKITQILTKTQFQKFSKLNLKKQKDYLRELIEGISGKNFAQTLGYTFSFDDLPMFNYILSINENTYNLSVYGQDEYFGFKCDYLLSENVFRLTLKKQEEINEDEDALRKILGDVSTDLLKSYKKTTNLEVTKKAKKLHDRMIGTEYLNEFSYNERKKNPIIV